MEHSSRIPEFYKLSVPERVLAMRERGLLTDEDYRALATGEHTLKAHRADKMIENVIGVLGLPVGLGLNFLINARDYVVPLVVEEPSIVAALSSAAKTVRAAGGFTVTSDEALLIGQIQVVGVADVAAASARLLQRKDEIINLANSLHPKMVARGGGARDLEVQVHDSSLDNGQMLVVHLLVDTCDAMGANLVNTMCEGVASLVEAIAEGKVFLRILSNLADRALVKARAVLPLDVLEGKGYTGAQVRDGIILATDLATVDPYRATTHNKGIMNGIDAVALATGNDWRALEAAAHAYAARSGRYRSLTRWYRDEAGNLVGELDMPLKVGIVGGTQQSNPVVAVNHRLLGVGSARELAEVMGAVGLAQNLAALRALVTDGIQQGHMTLHARNVATAAGAPASHFETVVERLVKSGEIKVWKAREIIAELGEGRRTVNGRMPDKRSQGQPLACGHGKVILLGEHAVVYGSHAIAAPVPLAIEAHVTPADEGVSLIIPRWGVEQRLASPSESRRSFDKPIGMILDRMGLSDQAMRIEVFPQIPRAMGLGSSAAVAVAIIRALDRHYRLGITEEQLNSLAYECEKVAHGTPSGIDNTMATYGRPLLFRKGSPPLVRHLDLPGPVSLVIGMTGVESLTAKMVARVREAWQKSPALYERIFAEIDTLTLQGVEAIESHDLEQLGELMNICQGLLNALQVSSRDVETLIQIARQHGALGAKLTGSGGGGSIVALCPEAPGRVVNALNEAGYQAMEVTLG